MKCKNCGLEFKKVDDIELCHGCYIKQNEIKNKHFKIQVETKQLWEVETEAETQEEAKKIRDIFYNALQETLANIETQFPSVDEPEKMFHCVETFGGDDLTDDGIIDLEVEELPEAERASLTTKSCLFSTCPECGSETEYDDEQEEYGRIMADIESDGFAVIECPNCETKYRQVSYKEY